MPVEKALPDGTKEMKLQQLWQMLILRPAYWPLLIALWGLIAAASYFWNYSSLENHARQMAVLRGRLVFTMVQTTRAWVAMHGGVYGPVTEKTPPNPYLDLPGKVIPKPDGELLTKINPAYMTRQLGELLADRGDLRIHITSLKPIRPGNAPDDWERDALYAFERGESERVEIVGAGTNQMFRYMAPLKTEKACLACHAKQGYREGDVRGGLSVTQPARYVLNIVEAQRFSIFVVHIVMFLLLSCLTIIALRTTRRQMIALGEERDQRRIAAERLAEKVAELETTRDELVQSEKMASLGRMVAGFAHEVNTPVGIAVGAVSNIQETIKELRALVSRDEVTEEDLLTRFAVLEEASGLTLANVRRAASLVQSFKRTSVDQTSGEMRDFTMSEVISDVRVNLNNLFKKSHIVIDLDCPLEISGHGAVGALHQVLINLMMNSYQHAFGDGKREGMIRIVVRQDALGWIRLDYSDDGTGIDPAIKENIFEPFFTTRRGKGGSGLGLYIAYSLVTNSLCGNISFDSSIESGTRFILQFPARHRFSGSVPPVAAR